MPTWTHRFAASDGVHTLYKFRPYDTEEHRRWVREILVDHKVYFSRASQLNDEHDLKPLLQFRKGSTDEETRRMLLDDAERVWARRAVPLPPDVLERYRIRLRTERLEVLEREALERTHRRLEDEYWVLSLAGTRDWVPMWEDYAGGRRGVCIHFRSDEGSPFGFAQRVIYQAERPLLLVPFADLTDQDVTERSTLTKTLRWRLEEEYRWVRYPDMDYEGTGFRIESQHGYFDPRMITGITVGSEMPEAHVREILELAAKHSPVLPVSRPRPDSIISERPLDVV